MLQVAMERPSVLVLKGKEIVISWGTDHKRRVGSTWLQMNCQCQDCRTQSYTPYTNSADQFISSADIVGDELHCTIKTDDNCAHLATLPLDYLYQTCRCDLCFREGLNCRDTVRLDPKSPLPTVEFQDIYDDQGLFRCLENIINHGFCVMKNVTVESQDDFIKLVEMTGSLKPTYYGPAWNVVNDANAVNVAYTTVKLFFHQDLPSYATAPGVQHLFAYRFDDDVVGGESQLVDLLECAEQLRREHPEHFKTLCRVPGTWATIDMNRDSPAYYEHRKPHIEVDYFGKVIAVNWSPTFEGTLRVKEGDVEKYYSAYQVFMKIIENPRNQVYFRLQTGDLLMFNNHRMGHSREAYSTKAFQSRHLFGCYTDLDELRCKYVVLADKLGKKVTQPRIGNLSSF